MFPSIPEAKLGAPGGIPWSFWPGMRRSGWMIHGNFWGGCCFRKRINIWKLRWNSNICSSWKWRCDIGIFQVGMGQYVWFWRVTAVMSWGAQLLSTSFWELAARPYISWQWARDSSWYVILKICWQSEWIHVYLEKGLSIYIIYIIYINKQYA